LIDQAVASQPTVWATITDRFERSTEAIMLIRSCLDTARAGKGRQPYLTFWGQSYVQGYYGGKRLAEAGATRGVCINHQVGHTGLDARCNGFVDAFTEEGVTVEVFGVNGDDPAQVQTTISDFYTANPDVDAVLTMGPAGSDPFYVSEAEA
jgi:simple sugar transport system substrate-binding protein